jgi:hypothetical protein
MSNRIKDSRVVCRCDDVRPARAFFKLPEGFTTRCDPLRPHIFVLTLIPHCLFSNRARAEVSWLQIFLSSFSFLSMTLTFTSRGGSRSEGSPIEAKGFLLFQLQVALQKAVRLMQSDNGEEGTLASVGTQLARRMRRDESDALGNSQSIGCKSSGNADIFAVNPVAPGKLKGPGVRKKGTKLWRDIRIVRAALRAEEERRSEFAEATRAGRHKSINIHTLIQKEHKCIHERLDNIERTMGWRSDPFVKV